MPDYFNVRKIGVTFALPTVRLIRISTEASEAGAEAAWLLAGGIWNDDGIWDDDAVWED